MTWGEFKSKVDQALSENGKDGSIEIWYIDVTFPERVRVAVSEPRAERVPMLEVSS